MQKQVGLSLTKKNMYFTQKKGEIYKLQICKENETVYHDYIISTPIRKYEDGVLIGIHLKGSYFGSGTKLSNIGTFYYYETGERNKIKIRLLDDTDQILFEHQLNDNDIDKLANLIEKDLDNFKPLSSNSQEIGNVKLHSRDLYRFENHPYEISGITLHF